MRKNKLMRAAAGLMVATLLTTSIISGTLAKYTTKVESSDKARVATWGFTESSIDLTDLFSGTYDNVKSGDSEKVIAPGTTKNAKFSFTYNGETAKPEVTYSFKVDTSASEVDKFIKANKNIKWTLDNGTAGTWDELMSNIKALAGGNDGEATYQPGNLPTGFSAKNKNEHTIKWEWDFNQNNSTTKEYWVKNDNTEVLTTAPTDTTGYTAMTQDEYDTYMGNMSELDDVKVAITITATQID